jgi:hypothetical protein
MFDSLEVKVLFTTGKRVAGDSSETSAKRAAELLNGQKLIRFSMSPKSFVCTMTFDLGATLRTQPYGKDDDDQWTFLEPTGKALILSNHGHYVHVPSDQHPDRYRWRPVRQS